MTVLLIIFYIGYRCSSTIFRCLRCFHWLPKWCLERISNRTGSFWVYGYRGQKYPIVPCAVLFMMDDLPIMHGLPGPLHGSLNLRECIYRSNRRGRGKISVGTFLDIICCLLLPLSSPHGMSIPLYGTAWRKIQIPDLRNLSKSHFPFQEGQVDRLIPGDQHPT